ncbi:PREDICTED: probable inactive serine/threonine-protein kinase bub1 [Tarenaya hassleriana]|uniref:probable inactive serine/threonine-protein kinase bub1 n=1 Tax=Tarenaya hassleriana TaxID=28532 RepID=UPI00053C34DD|nr:PREDICTED: probable inactive serine/threonine-protein kinase bub1 [Tarenaya hassleriana]
MAKNDNGCDKFLSSLISDIKSYSGKDPLLPWIRGVKKMKENLSPQILNEKLPRFLQKCAQSFESDKRYRNDSRYIRVWLQLMDFVEDPKALLRTMEANCIGTKRPLFYQAYALYYEKMKRFDDAEKMYRLGMQTLAEPMDELQKSYEQFLSRMEKHEKKNIQRQELKTTKRPLSEKSLPLESDGTKRNKESLQTTKPSEESDFAKVSQNDSRNMSTKQPMFTRQISEPRLAGNDDTVVVKFVDTAIVGKSEAEDVCHHGLVDPTINMKEAMNAINNMFKEPIETAPVHRRSQRNQHKENQSFNNGFEVFVDENLENGTRSREKAKVGSCQASQANQEPFEIFIDDDNCDESADGNDEVGVSDEKGFIFLRPKDHSSESSEEADIDSPPKTRFREDTVVHRFVGSTISEEPMVENVCHHGLVDPTINLKEAMEDINNMFGKPIDFVRPKRSKRLEKPAEKKPDPSGGFLILEDDEDELEYQESNPTQMPTNKPSERDLFEPTMCTKEAVDEINKLFTMPMDF